MNYFNKVATATIFGALLTGCSNVSTPKGVDLSIVADRTVMAFEYAEEKFEKPTSKVKGEAQLDNFSLLMHQAMNSGPTFYKNPIGIRLGADAKFTGFADANNNNIADPGDKDIFTVEVDSTRNRIIVTDTASGEGTYRVSGTGLFAGYMIGRLMGRQRRAGVKSSSFANRNVKSKADYRKSRPAPRARSRTRSGSGRAGK